MAVRKLKPTSAGRRFQTVSPKRLVVTTMVVSPAAVAAVA